MTTTNDEHIAFAQLLADAAGDVIRRYFRHPIDVTDKGAKGARPGSSGSKGYDPVTIADQKAEEVMRTMIKSKYPSHGIVGEEAGEDLGDGTGGSNNAYRWLLDPIDGTRAFICGQMQWGTLIALNDGTRPIVGVLDQPITRERWIGDNDHASLTTAEGGTKTIRTRSCPDLASAILMTTHPTAYFDDVEQPLFDRVPKKTRMTRYGGDCYMYGLLAMGFVDLIIEAQLHAWDVQALIPIVHGAGGVFTSWDGGDAQNGGRIIAAGDRRVHAEAMALLACTPVAK